MFRTDMCGIASVSKSISSQFMHILFIAVAVNERGPSHAKKKLENMCISPYTENTYPYIGEETI
ncbi:hypothetical protein C6370_09860 [Bacillus atrophaeus]|nr:hypothetical protein A1D11_00425 [Bacillus subtilis subsp. globigii]ATO27118.1 hypothetical protein RA13_03085 [Bacillus atrophaeus]KXZ19220.1 hypothetical protein AXI57_01100 [Bacillus atrophaeus]MBG9760033.1 hypothetical protein [Bacillus atrophaeus]PRR91032.1 hypothetical protein C6W23_05210 [Bacillus atrophaeus]